MASYKEIVSKLQEMFSVPFEPRPLGLSDFLSAVDEIEVAFEEVLNTFEEQGISLASSIPPIQRYDHKRFTVEKELLLSKISLFIERARSLQRLQKQ